MRALCIALLLTLTTAANAADDAVQAAAERIRDLQTMNLMLAAAIIAILLFLALRMQRDGRRLRDLSMTDELTRLPNRQHLIARAEEMLEQSHATQKPLSLIAFDIDNFKAINDRYGHSVGDQILRRVAHCCRLALRPTDRIGRTGGEAFTVVLPNAPERNALSVAVRLRVAVEMLPFDDIDPSLQVTISLGLAERSSTDTLVSLMAHAEQRLAQAKHDGRNRIIPAPG
jgi:diguanylate cyclase (GGDEF)-like protein